MIIYPYLLFNIPNNEPYLLRRLICVLIQIIDLYMLMINGTIKHKPAEN